MLVINNITDIKYSSIDKLHIDAKIQFKGRDDYLEYTASKTDKDSQEIFLMLESGKYGDVQEFIDDKLPEITQEEIEARLKKVTKVQEV